MMAMDDTIEVVSTTRTNTMEGVVPSQDGSVTAGKKKKKKRRTPATTELPPIRQPPNVALELHQLSGMKRGKVPPLVIENSVAVKEESVSQESDNGGHPTTNIPLPAHLNNDIPRSKFEHVTMLTNGSTLTGDATMTRNLMSKFESVATEMLESGKSVLSDKLNSTGSCDSHLSQARLKRRTTRRESKLASSQLLSTDVTSSLEQTLTHSLRPLPAGPVLPSKDEGTHHDTETHDNTLCDAEGNRIQNAEGDRVQDTGSDINIMGITVHSTDCLIPDVRLIHPLIQVHVVDMETGKYMKKSDRLKSAVSYYENLNENVDHIIPLQTQPAYYPNGIHRDLSVSWEEQLVINERLSYFTDNPNTILFFELLDFSKSMEPSSDGRSCDPGWHRMAWAFLKLVGGHGNPNTYKKCRLQLYRYPYRKRQQRVSPQSMEDGVNGIQIYHVWNSQPRVVYPSTLYVTVKGVCPPAEAFAVQRSMLPQQPEEGNITYEQLLQSHQYKKDITKVSHDSLATRIWKRLPGQTCQIPNQLIHTFSAGRMGCTAMAFSHSGCHLAVCCYENTHECTVIVYSIPDCKDHVRLVGHHGIIYHTHWSRDDTHLLTASQDTTVRHWDLSLSCQRHIVLPHACFVYDAIYHTSLDHVILTAGYDELIYIWTVHSTESRYGQCLHKLSGHHGYINTLCFGGEGNSLFSADSSGIICRWACPSSHDAMLSWKLDRTVTLPELQGHVIMGLQLQPTNHNRLLISTQKGKAYLMDTRVLHIIHCYHDNISIQNNQLVAVFSACGTYVLLASGHHLTVCRADNSTVVGQYQNLPLHHPITSLLFHPLDHMIVLSAFGDNEPVFLYHYNKDKTEGGVVDLLEPPVSEEATPLPSSHDVLVQNVRLQKAFNRLGLVTQQSVNGPEVVSGLESTFPSSVAASTGTLATPSEFTSQPASLHMPYSSTPHLASHPSNVPVKAVALFDYTAKRPNELSIHRGTQVTVINKRDPQWWLCKVGDREGYVPAGYVAVEQATSPLAYNSTTGSLDRGMNFQQAVSQLSKSAVTVKGKKKVKHKLP